MLFLFNTASRNTYLNNVISTLHLPVGCVNMYQYNYLVNSAVDSSAMNCSIGESVLITYIDKYSTKDNAFIPLRRGELIRTEKVDGRIYYYVKLLDYIHTNDLIQYSNILYSIFNKILYKKTKGIWEGKLAICYTKPEEPVSEVLDTSPDSWINTVKLISKREQFKDGSSLFTRAELTDSNGNTILTKKRGRTWLYELKKGKEYYLEISTYIADLFKNDNTLKIHVDLSGGADIINFSTNSYEIGNTQTHFKVPFTVKYDKKRTQTDLLITCKEEAFASNNKGISVSAIDNLNQNLKRAAIVLCVLTMMISTWINTLPVDSIVTGLTTEMKKAPLPPTKLILFNLCMVLTEMKYYYSAICSALITISTFGLIRLYGKPELF